jgi:hypothetical protein
MKNYVVRLVATTAGEKFKADKNGNLPYILQPVNGSRIDKGGIINGSVAHRLGLKAGSICSINITETKSADGQYTNFNHDLVSDLTSAVSTQIAANVVSQMMGSYMAPTLTPAVKDDTSPV